VWKAWIFSGFGDFPGALHHPPSEMPEKVGRRTPKTVHSGKLKKTG
jgi:hypothetical protein